MNDKNLQFDIEANSRKKENIDSSARLIFNSAGAGAFAPDQNIPHLPVLAAFGKGRLHMCMLDGNWDLERMVSDNADVLFRSFHKLSNRPEVATKQWDDLTFQLGRNSYIYADKRHIAGFALTAAEAECLVTRFGKEYILPESPAPRGGTFYLIQIGCGEIITTDVTLSVDTILKPETLNLHYGDGSWEWHQSFMTKLCERANGLSIFEGKPGTGKTHYLRHLMGELKKSHRFYFIPTSSMDVLSRSDFVEFWSEQRSRYSDKNFVVILEDSDAALMTRREDNREQVSALLNLSDGMLGDFLRLQIICTINCSATDIDQALLRPGRLLCHRIFGRLNFKEAARLAEKLGRTLPTTSDYSLAEVFAGAETYEFKRPQKHIGFVA